MNDTDNRFWTEKPLTDLSNEEWEALCDGCAKCCLHRFEDSRTREIHFTNVCCRYLDQHSCRCSDYLRRNVNVPECVLITPKVLEAPYWLPETCAYRLLAEGRPLPPWHPLVSGDPATVFRSGNAVCGRVISERETDCLEHHLIDWIR
ncbi:MAG: hypothetical protein B0D96_03455 [Candidatus Sedimenticola endophacoides]|uniref:UPF0260 protein B0D84_04590 n=1 Tax=Candidatus Sedimenticola endophacoides TaxID=2548426 RepID=A0A657Q2D0_9GAMM|nr:MAG: hypothetical protein B0D94_09380 [Candidatus Sedimenticola endophacoides]OQX33460.1 MAG: hypothetical protein B0D84_04590 [Candidatus Sedimenticola endophacoides]OQX36762.1 MAG: hypothetical protein B0D96_03455 [Candidatus Sedimenticola endophacoides]OQX40106.1 MAG: hypothetical protein B0D89_08980 [Candidatus Sedimenticola endophacoides]OQX44301.1 MAG: hypothetical protein B0D88_02740 [Candidatus Sedimenticola endophacoides]